MSYPNQANNIWPKTNTYRLHSDTGNRIIGMRSFKDTLFVWTKSTVYAGRLTERGQLTFETVSSAFGFSNHHGVTQIVIDGQETLVGITPKGIYTILGQPVLTEWSRVLPFGVNQGALQNSLATVLHDENLAFFAVPEKGKAENNLLVVYDFNTRIWTTWTLPFGCTYLTTSKNKQGKQELYLGTNDGFVCVLRDSATDDSLSITKTVQTHPMQLGSSAEVNINKITILAAGLGTGTITLSGYSNDEVKPYFSGAMVVNSGEATWGVSIWGTAYWGMPAFRPVTVTPPQTRASTFALKLTTTSKVRIRSIEIFPKILGTGKL
jgi:hypothetical protein